MEEKDVKNLIKGLAEEIDALDNMVTSLVDLLEE